MQASLPIAGADFLVDYDYKITYPGRPATRPSWSSPGEPAEPMEFEVTATGIRKDTPAGDSPSLAIPDWLKDVIEEDLAGRDDVYDAIFEDARFD